MKKLSLKYSKSGPMKNSKLLILLVLCLVFIFSVSCTAAGYEKNALVHYSESEIEAGQTVHLEQGYSIKIVDIGKSGPSSFIEIYHDDHEVDDLDDNIARNDSPIEYIITIEDDDDEDNETDYLLLSITPLEYIERSDSNRVKFKIEQYLDVRYDIDEFLLVDESKSVRVGESLELEEGYALEVLDIDRNSKDKVSLRLMRNDFSLIDDEIEIGDIFYYNREIDGQPMTIFTARPVNSFVSTHSEVVFFEQISQREYLVGDKDIDLFLSDQDKSAVKQDEITVVRYYIGDDDVQEAIVSLNNDIIDRRNSPQQGTYSVLLEDLDLGEHEIELEVVASDGTRLFKEISITVVDSTVDIGEPSLDDEIIPENTSSIFDNLKFWSSDSGDTGNGDEIEDEGYDLSDTPPFALILLGVLLVFGGIAALIVYVFRIS